MFVNNLKLIRTLNRIHICTLREITSGSSICATVNSDTGSSKQKSQLLDTFGRKHDYLRISLTEKCNLRCFYCMPAEGVQLTPSERLLSTDEIYRLAGLFVQKFGTKKIRLTGGEPLVRNDIVQIVQNLSKLKQFGLEKIAITTNGIVFARYSARLRQAGLDSVNISLDTLKKDRFQRITRRNGLEKVLSSIDAALKDQYESVKINCVPIKDVNDDEIEDFVELTRNSSLDVRFIEYMPFDGNRWSMDKMIGLKDLLTRLRNRYPNSLIRLPPKTPNETALAYQIDGFSGTIGFISSMTNAFCSSCNRVRLTADGHLKVCLFGKEEVSLKDSIRNGSSDEQIGQMIIDAVRSKKKQHAGALNIAKENNRPMILIARNFSTRKSSEFSHLDPETGQAKMVNIGSKQVTNRVAQARARVYLGHEILERIESNTIAKGNVLSLAKMAAIMGAKWTSHLIPLCHQIPLDQVDAHLTLDYEREEVVVYTTVHATYRTGVEMEALTAASIAALTIYDMCKAVNKSIVIRECRLVSKTGGKTDFNLDHGDK